MLMRVEYNFQNPKKNQYIKNEVKRFLDSHRDVGFSAAKFEYSMYLEPEMSKKIVELAESKFVPSEDDLKLKKIIVDATESNGLLRLMRKPMSGANRSIFREKLMEYESDLLPLIQEKCIRIKQDIFIENALYFFMNSKMNCCDWIMDTYQQFHSEYLKSMFCLVLGFRGSVSLISFLMDEARRMVKAYPDKYYDQGPALAVQELAVRYLN